jgi:hypothetical protein
MMKLFKFLFLALIFEFGFAYSQSSLSILDKFGNEIYLDSSENHFFIVIDDPYCKWCVEQLCDKLIEIMPKAKGKLYFLTGYSHNILDNRLKIRRFSTFIKGGCEILFLEDIGYFFDRAYPFLLTVKAKSITVVTYSELFNTEREILADIERIILSP